MKNNFNICFSANRICHHDDYFLLISKFDNVFNVKNFFNKLRYLFSKRTIYFLDIDKVDLIFFPFMILRSIWGAKGFGISVRTEYLVQSIELSDLYINWFKSKYFHLKVKQLIFLIIKKFSSTIIISIHKGHPECSVMSKYVNNFIYDPQLWDLKFLNFSSVRPTEIEFLPESIIILVAGQFNDQRSKSELLEYLQSKPLTSFHFIIAGKANKLDSLVLSSFNNVTHINRFLSNDELYFLFQYSDIVYCYYANNRPSGFFGRAVQLNKTIIVRKNSFLDNVFPHYSRKISISHLSNLNIIDIDNNCNFKDSTIYDDSDNFKCIISK